MQGDARKSLTCRAQGACTFEYRVNTFCCLSLPHCYPFVASTIAACSRWILTYSLKYPVYDMVVLLTYSLPQGVLQLSTAPEVRYARPSYEGAGGHSR